MIEYLGCTSTYKIGLISDKDNERPQGLYIAAFGTTDYKYVASPTLIKRMYESLYPSMLEKVPWYIKLIRKFGYKF